MKKLTLKLRLIIYFLIVAAGVWTASGALSWFETREQMDEFFDTYQLLLARQLSTVDWHNIRPDTQQKANKIIDNLKNDGEEEDEALGFAIFNKNGDMVFNDGENGKYFFYNSNPSGFINQTIGKKHKWRIVWIKTVDENFTIAVGQEIEFRNEAALEVVAQSLFPWIAGLIILSAASIFLVAKEFKPLKSIAKNLSLRNSDDLSPLDYKDIPQEIRPLLKSMNNLFKRINSMIERERGFISDSAHELRGPLTALRVQLEVALLSGDDTNLRNAALNNLSQGIERSTRLVEQLLALSRLETGQDSRNEENILDWKKMVDDIIYEQEPLMEEKNISVKFMHTNKVPIEKGQAILWYLLMRNLLDNATRYSPRGAEINIKIDDYRLEIINSGSGVDERHLEHLGKRFFRPPGQKENGSGLGLSIVKRIAELHHCVVDYRNLDNGFCVDIRRQS